MGLRAVYGLLLLSVSAIFGNATPVLADTDINSIVRSPHDKRDYLSVRLANGLTVLLISDPNSGKAAAALDIKVGSADEPRRRPGLAHLLEHALFLGTETYPRPGDFKAFVNRHGGSYNAFTTSRNSGYFFDINPAQLETALDRFAELFSAPLFPSAYLERERQAVDAEYNAKRNDDGWRERYVFKRVLNPLHPLARFSIGSTATLAASKDQLRSELLDFFQHHYSANVMNLVVLSKQPLPQLEAWVREKFSAIRTTKQADNMALALQEPLYLPNRLPARLHIVPIKDLRVLKLSFPIPSPSPHFRTKPLGYLSQLISAEGAGSLLALLQAKGWAERISARRTVNTETAATFDISLDLTRAGLENSDAVIHHLFQYLGLLRTQGIDASMYDEQKRRAEVAFRFREQRDPQRFVRWLASNLHKYPITEALSGAYTMQAFDAALIDTFLDLLRPDNVLITLIAKDLATDAIEPWFNAPYQISKIDEPSLQGWREASIEPQLALPQANPFLPENLALQPQQQESETPELILQKTGFALWYKQDASFGLPKADFYLSIRSPQTNTSATQAVLTQLFVELFNEQLAPIAYPARQAGLRFKLGQHLRGLSLKIDGYNDQLERLLTPVLAGLQSPQFKPERFAHWKHVLLQRWGNATRGKPYQRALAELNTLLLPQQWSQQQRLAALEALDFDQLQQFAQLLFTTVDVVGLAHGNLGQKQVQALAHSLQNTLASWPGRLDTPLPRQVVKLEHGIRPMRRFASQHGDSAVALYFQADDTSTSSQAQLKLLAQVLNAPFFQDLRTERQLGYVVFASSLSLLQVPGLVFVVQSPLHDPLTLSAHVDGFLHQQAAVIEQINDLDFERHKQGLISRVLEQEQNLNQRSERYWQEINNGQHEFDSREQLAQAIRAMTKTTFIASFQQLLLSQNAKRLTVLSYGDKHQVSMTEHVADGEASLIEDIPSFKQSLDYFSG